ncbi:MAG: hypothetical protein U0869_05150 [Chloroflexota bacterium]
MPAGRLVLGLGVARGVVEQRDQAVGLPSREVQLPVEDRMLGQLEALRGPPSRHRMSPVCRETLYRVSVRGADEQVTVGVHVDGD